MNIRYAIAIALLGLSLLVACSYEGMRMGERQRCGAMPQSEATRCYSRTQDTKSEYDTKRAQLKNSTQQPSAKPTDPRYEQWIP